jgi:hypothetical protein
MATNGVVIFGANAVAGFIFVVVVVVFVVVVVVVVD